MLMSFNYDFILIILIKCIVHLSKACSMLRNTKPTNQLNPVNWLQKYSTLLISTLHRNPNGFKSNKLLYNIFILNHSSHGIII